MSQVPLGTVSAATLSVSAGAATSRAASPSEKNASHEISSAGRNSSPSSSNKASPSALNTSTSLALAAPAPAPAPKVRSCVVCRTRKVRCDRQSPCSNCLRANIACVFPSTDRPPRWARRLNRVSNNAASNAQPTQLPDPAATQVMERLRNLESLVKDLSGQLEQANAAALSAASGSSGVNSPESSSHDRDTDHQGGGSSSTNAGNIQKQFGRLVLQDANRSRYVSSGFWSIVNDEVCQPVMFKRSS